jgi:hypothetical protein
MLILDKHRVAYLHINKTAGTTLRDYLSRVAGPGNQMGPTHGPLEANQRLLGPRFNDYTVLVSIRNPMARLFSMYLFRKSRYLSGEVIPPTEAAYKLKIKDWFFKIILNSKRLTDLSISDSILVDGEFMPNTYVVAVETLGKDMNKFCRERLGIPNPEPLPYLNKTNYGKEHYTKHFDDHFKEAVYKWDRWVIDNYYPWIL